MDTSNPTVTQDAGLSYIQCYKTKAHECVKGSRGRRPDGVERSKGEEIRVTRVHHTHMWNCQRTALIKIIIKITISIDLEIPLFSALTGSQAQYVSYPMILPGIEG